MQIHKMTFPDMDCNVMSIKCKFNELHKKWVPNGDPNCPNSIALQRGLSVLWRKRLKLPVASVVVAWQMSRTKVPIPLIKMLSMLPDALLLAAMTMTVMMIFINLSLVHALLQLLLQIASSQDVSFEMFLCISIRAPVKLSRAAIFFRALEGVPSQSW